MNSAVAAAAVLTLSACEGPAAEIIIVLEPFDEATKEVTRDLQAFRVVLRIAGEPKPQVFEFDVGQDKNPRLAATVTPDQPFTVDVLGCPTPDVCAPEDVTVRGCTPTVTSTAGEPTSFAVKLFAIAGPLAPDDPPACGVGPDDTPARVDAGA